jgi:putative heme degradation protein
MSENTIDPNELTSPGTVDDPALEQRRAEEAAVREAESRATDETKFEQLRKEEEGERSEAAHVVANVPEPRDASSEGGSSDGDSTD